MYVKDLKEGMLLHCLSGSFHYKHESNIIFYSWLSHLLFPRHIGPLIYLGKRKEMGANGREIIVREVLTDEGVFKIHGRYFKYLEAYQKK